MIGTGEVVKSEFSNGENNFHFSDALGSVTALTNTQGILTNRSEYDAFGLQSSNGATANSIGYTGQRFDVEMNLFSAIVRSHIFELLKFFKILEISRSQIIFLKLVGTLDNVWVGKYNAVPQTDKGVLSRFLLLSYAMEIGQLDFW